MHEFDQVTLQQWSVIVGFIMPAIIAVLNRSTWSNSTRALVAFVVSIVAAFVTTYLEAGVDAENVVSSAILVFATAIGTYHVWWKPSTIAPTIEVKTTPSA